MCVCAMAWRSIHANLRRLVAIEQQNGGWNGQPSMFVRLKRLLRVHQTHFGIHWTKLTYIFNCRSRINELGGPQSTSVSRSANSHTWYRKLMFWAALAVCAEKHAWHANIFIVQLVTTHRPHHIHIIQSQTFSPFPSTPFLFPYSAFACVHKQRAPH